MDTREKQGGILLAGLIVFWRHAHRRHVAWSTNLLVSSILLGFGAFNVIEALVDHQILGLHHVNETAPHGQWIYWDLGFLVWGALIVAIGWALLRRGRRETADAPAQAAKEERLALLAATRLRTRSSSPRGA